MNSVNAAALRAPFRLLRTTALGLAMMFLAISAHVLAGGSLPPLLILLALSSLVLLSSSILTRFRLNLPALAAILGAGQVLLHQSFEILAAPTSSGAAGAMSGAHVHDFQAFFAASRATGSATLESSGSMAGMSAGHSPLMMLMHAIATAVMAVLIAKGEAALWQLAAWLRPLFRALWTPATPLIWVPQAPQHAEPPRLPWRTLRRDRLRGPPRLAVVL